MATYTKETALYDTGKIGNDINTAGQTATNYITNISGVNGISVHNTNDTSNFVNMNSEGVNVYQGGTDVAHFGPITRIGTSENASITIAPNSLAGVGENNTEFFRFENGSVEAAVHVSDEVYHIESITAWPKTEATGRTYTCSDTPVTDEFLYVTYYIFADTLGSSILFGIPLRFTSGTSGTLSGSKTYGNNSITVYATYDGSKNITKMYITGSVATSWAISVNVSYSIMGLAPTYAIGGNLQSTGAYSLAEGSNTTASGDYSHAEGSWTVASGNCSHTEGYGTEASGNYSHAEGYNTEAFGNDGNVYVGFNHAEGRDTLAKGAYSHAGGYTSKALGMYSFAHGSGVEVNSSNGTAFGKYNNTSSSHAFVIGNGSSDTNRSNAFEVDWDGNVNIAPGAKYKINGTELAASDVGAVPTTRKVNNKALSADVTLSASDVSAVPTTRKVNNKALSADITLSASDVSAVPTTRKVNNKALSADITLSASDVSAVPTTRKVNNKALSADITLSASDVGAVPTTRTINNYDLSDNVSLTATDVGAVPTTRKVNNKALSADITLSASDVSAVPTTRTVNSKALSSNITLTAADVSAVPTTRTVNSKALSSNITLTAADVSAVPTTRTINNYDLSDNVSLTATDVGAVPTTRTVNGKALSANVADADYVTEEGSKASGSVTWTYRKWNSGKIEAWCGYTFASSASTVWTSPIRYWDKTVNIPSGIFSAAPRVMATSQSTQYWVGGCTASNATTASIRVLTAASGSMALNVNIYAIAG